MLEQKAELAVRLRQGDTMTALCQEFGISRPTGYLWARRFEQGGVMGCQPQSRRPQFSPQRTAEEIEQRVVRERQQRPDWGARKLRERLRQQDIELPVPTIHRILRRHGLIRKENQHRPAVRRFQREQPNELWQMDFKGPQGFNRGAGPLSILDDHSRFVLALREQAGTRGEPVRECLEQVFREGGVPAAMLLDHGTPWWNMQSPTGWTWLTVWLMKQNIHLLFCAYRHPQTQGKIERFHGTLQRAVRERFPRPGAPLEQAWLDEFRYEYNHLRPHEALDMTTPAQHWRKSDQAYEARPRWDYETGAEVHRLGSAGQLWWKQRRWTLAKLSPGRT